MSEQFNYPGLDYPNVPGYEHMTYIEIGNLSPEERCFLSLKTNDWGYFPEYMSIDFLDQEKLDKVRAKYGLESGAPRDPKIPPLEWFSCKTYPETVGGYVALAREQGLLS